MKDMGEDILSPTPPCLVYLNGHPVSADVTDMAVLQMAKNAEGQTSHTEPSDSFVQDITENK